MKKTTLPLMWFMLAADVMASAAGAQTAALKVGDAAPKLQVSKWMQGEPVKDFKPGTAYVVEFWTTWYIPCSNAVAHLNELHEKFKDKGLVVIGVNALEDMLVGKVKMTRVVPGLGTEDPEGDGAAVARFMKQMGDKMTYRVALDDKSGDDDGAMAVNWIKAAKQNDIPVAFVINKEGRVVWIGQPNSLTETFLEKVLADRLDMAQAIAEFEQNEKKKVRLSQLPGQIIKAIRNRNWSDAETALAELEKLAPERQSAAGTFRFQILLGRKDYAAAYKLAGSLSDSNKSDSSLQNDLARTIVYQKGLDERDVALAEEMAARANDAAKGKDPSFLDTLARAQFMNGKKKEAVDTEQKALEVAPDSAKRLFENRLKSFEDGQLPALDE